MSEHQIINQWRDLLERDEAQYLLIGDHPLRLYYGINERGEPAFYLNSAERPKVPDFSKIVRVETRFRQGDQTWNLVMALEDSSHAEQFMFVCQEIVERSAVGSDPDECLHDFYVALGRWKALFAKGRSDLLSEEEMRGLAGELWVALDLLSHRYPLREVVDAWAGPYEAPQDFQFADGRAIEVKATRLGARTIHISSLQQLEPDEFSSLAVAVVAVETGTTDSPTSWTLPMLAGMFRERLRDDEQAIEQLQERFDKLHFDDGDHRYSETYFRFNAIRLFEVVDGFPRIKKAAGPPGVENAKYEIVLQSLQPFLVPGDWPISHA